MRCGPARRNGRSRGCAAWRSPRTCARNSALPSSGRPTARSSAPSSARTRRRCTATRSRRRRGATIVSPRSRPTTSGAAALPPTCATGLSFPHSGLPTGGESRRCGNQRLVRHDLNRSGTSLGFGVKLAFCRGTDWGTDMTETVIRRRSLLKAGAAASVLTAAPGLAWAQPKIAPPNIIKAGTLVMSINPTLPPLQYVDDKGELKGMRVELANECCKKLGLAPEYIRTEFATMIPGLAAKRWDMINTGIFWTEERSKLMYMIPYEQAAISFLATKGNPQGLKTVDDLAGKRIAVELGGIEERRTREVAKMAADKGLKPVNVMTFNNFAEAFQALRAGQADAATSIDATAMFMQNRGDFTRAISGVFPQTACFALANKTAADAIVGALSDLKKDGT